jgi:hypothetical protein
MQNSTSRITRTCQTCLPNITQCAGADRFWQMSEWLEPLKSHGCQVRSAGFLTCRIADFLIGSRPNLLGFQSFKGSAEWRFCDTAAWKGCATCPPFTAVASASWLATADAAELADLDLGARVATAIVVEFLWTSSPMQSSIGFMVWLTQSIHMMNQNACPTTSGNVLAALPTGATPFPRLREQSHHFLPRPPAVARAALFYIRPHLRGKPKRGEIRMGISERTHK